MEFSYPIKCPKCEYRWETKAHGEMITCPSCMRKFSRPPPVIENISILIGTPTTCDRCGQPFERLTLCRLDGRTALMCAGCLRSVGGEPTPPS